MTVDAVEPTLFRRSVSAVLLVIGIGVGYHAFQRLNSVPACDGDDTKKAIYSMLSRIPRALEGRATVDTAVLGDIKEIGHVSLHGQRGCSATVKYGDETIPYAYVVALEPEKGGFSVGGFNPAIVQARFGKTGQDGEFGNLAQPVGRDQLESAMRTAIEGMRGPGRAVTHDPKKTVEDIFNHVNPDRNREIADLEPIGPCRAIQPGTRYACRVMIERNDPLMTAFGMPAEILEAEFTFERTSAGGAWRMSDDFGVQFSEAIAKARTKTIAPRTGS